MKKFLATLLLAAVMLTGASFCVEYEPAAALEPVATPVHAVAEQVNLTEKRADIPQPVVSKAPVVQPEEPMEEPNAVTLTQEEIDLIALSVMAEAEGEPEEGQRLVIDTILNRVDDPRFPGNVHDVIYQKNQFAGMYGERIERCYVKEELVQLVREELENRTNSEVVFFRTGHYHSYGVPLFQVGAHYFSSYE